MEQYCYMKYPRILIHYVSDITDIHSPRNTYPYRAMMYASIAFLVDNKHFRCVKNRWDEPSEQECVPKSLLKAYIMQYEEHFTKEELVDALAYETAS